jgi:hypothetical protein
MSTGRPTRDRIKRQSRPYLLVNSLHCKDLPLRPETLNPQQNSTRLSKLHHHLHHQNNPSSNLQNQSLNRNFYDSRITRHSISGRRSGRNEFGEQDN